MQPRTLLTARWISSLFMASLLLTSCVHLGPEKLGPDRDVDQLPVSKQRIYFSSFDSVWHAAHAVLKYTIANENPDTGTIETEYIKGVDGWIAPEEKKPTSTGLRYKIIVTLAKGNAVGRESTRVTVEKRIEVLKDFFSDPTVLESDGLEESAIFYRLERELIINDALKKAG